MLKPYYLNNNKIKYKTVDCETEPSPSKEAGGAPKVSFFFLSNKTIIESHEPYIHALKVLNPRVVSPIWTRRPDILKIDNL